MSAVELWHRPWSRLDVSDKHYTVVGKDVTHESRGPIWLCSDGPDGLIVDGKPSSGVPDNTLDDGRRIFVMPIPLRSASGMKVRTASGVAHLVFPMIPDRPLEPAANEKQEAKTLSIA